MVPRDTATRPPVFCNYKVTPGPFLRNPLNGESVSRDEMPKKLNIVGRLCPTPLASPSRRGPQVPVLPPRGPWPRPRWGGPLPVRVETPEPGRRPARAFLRARAQVLTEQRPVSFPVAGAGRTWTRLPGGGRHGGEAPAGVLAGPAAPGMAGGRLPAEGGGSGGDGPRRPAPLQRPRRRSTVGPRKILETLRGQLEAGSPFLRARSTCGPRPTRQKPGPGRGRRRLPAPRPPPPQQGQEPAGPRKPGTAR